MGRPLPLCLCCGRHLPRGGPRVRMYRTPDSTVRTTTVLEHLHEECAEALIADLKARRLASEARTAWAHGPRFRLAGGAAHG